MILRRAIFLLAGLLLATLTVWAITFRVADAQSILLGTGALAFGLGLRHAIDPDHLAAIDNVTRKLTGEGKTPVAVGLFFAVGHSAFVVLVVLLLSFTALKLGEGQFALFQNYGNLFSSLFSAIFLFLIGFINLKSLIATRRQLGHHNTPRPLGRIWTRYVSPLFGSISQSHHMVLIGFLFALSFDTATEISLFGLTAAQGLGHSLTLRQTLIFPLLFASGMILIDTINGLMMLGAYRWAAFDGHRKQVYNTIITGFSVFAAFGIGSLQMINLAASQMNGSDVSETLVSSLMDHPTTLGSIMIAMFAMIWISAFAMSKFARFTPAAWHES